MMESDSKKSHDFTITGSFIKYSLSSNIFIQHKRLQRPIVRAEVIHKRLTDRSGSVFKDSTPEWNSNKVEN